MISYELSYWYEKKIETVNEDGKMTAIEKTMVVSINRNEYQISVFFSEVRNGQKPAKCVWFNTKTQEKEAFEHFANITQHYKNFDGWQLKNIKIEVQ